ncbi:MAG: iron dependent repressor, metal binding and dimerization domain protein [Pirellulales bacterium]
MKGNVVFVHGTWRLTDQGRKKAAQVVRSHRLWEAWLFNHLGLPVDHVHDPAERMEHYIGEQLEVELREAFQGDVRDPHGREIPK